MEDRYQHTQDGQEVNETDINGVSTAASLADDHVFAEMFRLGAGAKGVVAASPTSALVQPSGSADAKTVIGSFRAFVGPLSATTGQDAYKNARSAVAASSVDLTQQTVVHPAQSTNNRWDLIYARVDVDIDGPSILRFVKTGTTPAGQQSIVTLKQTTVTISVVSGSSAATPTKPALPSDSGSSHYIPLAYVLLLAGHTLTTAIPKAQIDEVAPVLQISRATGASSMRIANGSYKEGGFVITNETWTPATGRPKGYIPPTMGGSEKLLFALSFLGATRSIPLGTAGLIDDSVDWRNRRLRTHVTIAKSGTKFPWETGGSDWLGNGALPDDPAFTTGQLQQKYTGQSFHDNSGSAIGSVLADINNTTTGGFLAASVQILIFVDLSTGNLKAKIGATDPASILLIEIDASGQFNNAF